MRDERLIAIEEGGTKLFEDIRRAMMKAKEGEVEVGWEPPQYELSENERELTDAISVYFPQLAPVVAFCLSAQLGRKNVMLIGPKAAGKSVTEYYLRKYSRNRWLDLSKFKDDERGMERMAEILSGSSVDIGIDDLSEMALVESGAMAQKLFSMVSQLSFTHNYSTPEVEIRDADISMVAAAMHVAAESVMRAPIWEAQGQDRFLRFWYVYYARPSPTVRIGHSDPIPDPPKLDFAPKAECILPESKYSCCTEFISFQISEERAVEFSRDILRGHAMLAGREVVGESDVEWLRLYEPIFRLEPALYMQQKRRVEIDLKGYEALYFALKSPISMRNLSALVKLSARDVRTTLLRVLRVLGGELAVGDAVEVTGPWVAQLRHLFDTYAPSRQ